MEAVAPDEAETDGSESVALLMSVPHSMPGLPTKGQTSPSLTFLEVPSSHFFALALHCGFLGFKLDGRSFIQLMLAG